MHQRVTDYGQDIINCKSSYNFFTCETTVDHFTVNSLCLHDIGSIETCP